MTKKVKKNAPKGAAGDTRKKVDDLLVQGKSVSEISKELGIAVGTVSYHKQALGKSGANPATSKKTRGKAKKKAVKQAPLPTAVPSNNNVSVTFDDGTVTKITFNGSNASTGGAIVGAINLFSPSVAQHIVGIEVRKAA